MSWFSKLFKPAPAKALCVRVPGAYLIDLSPLPVDCARIIGAFTEIIAAMKTAREPLQLWVLPPAIVAHYWSEATSVDDVNALVQAFGEAGMVSAATVVVEPGTPPGFIKMFTRLGFDVAGPDIKLQLVDGDGRRREVAVLDQLAKIRASGTGGTVVI